MSGVVVTHRDLDLNLISGLIEENCAQSTVIVYRQAVAPALDVRPASEQLPGISISRDYWKIESSADVSMRVAEIYGSSEVVLNVRLRELDLYSS